MFEYDQKQPLDVVETGVDGLIHDITYASPRGGRVPACLVAPPGRGPHAAVIYMHPGQGNRRSFLDEALALASAGVVSLLIDAPYLRPEFAPPSPDAPPDAAAGAHFYRQLVTDIRRGVDLLTARPDVDPARIGYVGHSLGATWGGPLAGVEKRIRAFVLMAGYPSLTEWHRTSLHPFAAQFRSSFPGPAEFERYLRALAPLDGVHYVGKASPSALLFQFAHNDDWITREQAEQYYATASQPKEVRWYQADHLFTGCPAARLDRTRWLDRQLGLGALPDSLLARLESL